jgi:hypothetical protein
MCLPNFENHPSQTDSMKWDNAALAGLMPTSRAILQSSFLIWRQEYIHPEGVALRKP